MRLRRCAECGVESSGEYCPRCSPFMKNNLSSSKLEQLNQLNQSIHNLKVRFPIGIRSIDDSHDEKLKRLEALSKELYG